VLCCPVAMASLGQSLYGACMPAWQPEHALAPSTRRVRMLWISLAAIAGALCCSGCAPVPPETPADDEEPRQEQPSALVVEGDVGGLSQEDVDEVFQKLGPEVQRCAEAELRRNEAFGGTCTVHLRIGRDGQARWAYLKQSTLGDRSTEQCILEAVRARDWPKPLGGEGEAVHDFTIESGTEIPSWSSTQVRKVQALVRHAASACVRRTKGRFWVTVYVRGDGSVLGTGVAPPSAPADVQSDCVVAGLQKLNLGRQKNRLSKATFRIP
jgi:hypothetical protein